MRKYFIALALLTMSMLNVSAQEMTYSPTATRFALWSPKAEAVKVNIYANGIDGKPLKEVMLSKAADATVWTATVREQLKGRFYTFQIKTAGKWLEETPGTFAKAVGVNGKRGAIIDLADTNPEGWMTDRSPAFNGMNDAVIYEMHHRDFSVGTESGIRNKGKFLALTETGTHNASGLATGIDHLKELGITHVHLLPSYDFGSIDETTGKSVGGGGRIPSTYNWGYDPVNYNTPEGSYSTNAYDPATRIREFKQMVMALHKAGIRVVMDVVYNHVFDHDASSFQRTAPGEFFRYKADGSPANGSGCGNETASDHFAMAKYMIESVEYWMREYHIDGFRFDLMGIHDIRTMNAIREMAQSLDPNVIIYGEGWAAEAPAYPAEMLAMKANTSRLGGIAAFGDEMRDGLRGGWQNDKDGAFLIGKAGNEESVKFGIVGGIEHSGVDLKDVNYSKVAWAAEPTQMISYVSCHDDMCVADRLKTTLQTRNGKKKVTTEEIARLQKLAYSAVLTSQGVPFIWCGDEIMRDRKGVHNCYSSPDSINAIPWELKTEHKDVFDYIRTLIAMRKAHPAFRMGCADLVRQHLDFLPLEKKQRNIIAFHLNGKAVGDSWSDIVVILNSNTKAITQQIPEGAYSVIAIDGKCSLDGLGTVKGKKVIVPAQSALIIWK